MTDWIVYPSRPSQRPNFKDPQITDTRRKHSKSRTGCTVCKQRRIKCDETRPACRQCVDYGRHCSYLSEMPQDLSAATLHQIPQDHDAKVNEVFEQVWDKLESRAEMCTAAEMSVQRSTLRASISHFIGYSGQWMCTPTFQKLIRRHGIQVGLHSEYLLHAILSWTASHMAHLEPCNTIHKLVAAFHYSLSIRQYQERLNDIRPEDIDGVFACGILHILMVIHYIPSNNTIEPDAPVGFSNLLIGIRSIKSFPGFYQTFRDRAMKAQGVFQELFEVCNLPGQAIETSAQESDAISHRPKHLKRPSRFAELEHPLRALVDDSTFEDVYRAPFEYLNLISEFVPDTHLIDLFLSFASQLKGGYVEALEAKEPAALLLVCYWYVLLLEINQWWITIPAVTLCGRFDEYLERALPENVQDRQKLLAPLVQAMDFNMST